MINFHRYCCLTILYFSYIISRKGLLGSYKRGLQRPYEVLNHAQQGIEMGLQPHLFQLLNAMYATPPTTDASAIQAITRPTISHTFVGGPGSGEELGVGVSAGVGVVAGVVPVEAVRSSLMFSPA